MPQFSASQLSTALLCRRKRRLERQEKLPQPKKGYFAFGTILHAVLERFLEADDLGRDNKGDPVDLYPEGWETITVLERVREGKAKQKEEISCEYEAIAELVRDGWKVVGDKSLHRSEQATIQTLVTQAIEEGVVERRPGAKVEEMFNIPVDKSLEKTTMVGFIDYGDATSVDDHKTSKNKRYLKSTKTLGQDLQMLVYAYVKLYQSRKRGLVDPEYIELTHNQFIKEPPIGVRKTSTRVTPAYIQQYWDRVIVPLCHQVIEDTQVENPMDIPDPAGIEKIWIDENGELQTKTVSACSAFGGCAYVNVCNGRETIEHYRKRIDKFNGSRQTKPQDNTKGEPVAKKSLTQMLQERKKKSEAPAAAETAEVQSASEPDPQTAVEEVEEGMSDRPPWSKPGCVACDKEGKGKHPGFNTKGGACRICGIHAKKTGLPSSDGFTIQVEDGTITWSDEDGEHAGVSYLTEEPEQVQVKQGKDTVDAPAEDPEPEEEAPPAAEKPASKKKKAKTKATNSAGSANLTVLIGASFLKAPDGDVLLAERVFNDFVEDLYSDSAAPDNVFDMRREVGEAARSWAQGIKSTTFLIYCINSPDIDAMISALASTDATVIRGAM